MSAYAARLRAFYQTLQEGPLIERAYFGVLGPVIVAAEILFDWIAERSTA